MEINAITRGFQEEPVKHVSAEKKDFFPDLNFVLVPKNWWLCVLLVWL